MLGAAGYFFYEMKLVKEDRAGQELDQYDEGLVDNKLTPMVNAINEALANNEDAPEKGALEMSYIFSYLWLLFRLFVFLRKKLHQWI